MRRGQVLSQHGGELEDAVAHVTLEGVVGVGDLAAGPEVAVQLEVLLQLEGLGEGLTADLAEGADLPRVLAHVVQEVLALAEDVAAGVALVLDLPRVDGDVLLEGLEAGELAVADGAHKVAVLVLDSVVGLGRYGVCNGSYINGYY